MPPKLESLFHPKKKIQGRSLSNHPSPTGKPGNQRKDDDDDDLKLPETPFQEFRLLSSALNGWKYDVMRFDSRKPVDIHKWHLPVKLNRKDLRRNDEVFTSAVPQAVGPMLGPDGKPVIGPDGKTVMVDSDGRPIQPLNEALDAQSQDKTKAVNTKKRFQKKTRQVFPVAEGIRQLRREERYPWVVEDSSANHNEVWIAQMEDLGKGETHALFMPAANEVFKFVPSHRWYRFQKKLKHDLPTDLANVESLYNLNQKRDPQQWLATRKGKAPSNATTAMFKAESEGKDVSIGPSLVLSSGQSLGPGGRKLKTVDSGMDHLFEAEEDGDGDGLQKRKRKELGEEGDMDEQVYEEDFADDEEQMEVGEDDEEAKEAEERLKKEYRTANKQRDAGVDVSDNEEETPAMSKQAKAMQKLIRNREGNDAYESDEDKNPYASSEEDEEEQTVLPTATSAIQEQQQKIESTAQTPKPAPAPTHPPAQPGTRATSPHLFPSHGGHSLVAKRATSPKIPKPKVSNISQGSSLLGVQPNSAQSRSSSPTATEGINGSTLKRKADGPGSPPVSSPTDAQPPKQKKRKATGQSFAIPSANLEAMLVEWLKTTANSTTRDCIHHFTPYLVDAEKKAEFSAMVRKHASLKNGVLVPRNGVRATSLPAI